MPKTEHLIIAENELILYLGVIIFFHVDLSGRRVACKLHSGRPKFDGYIRGTVEPNRKRTAEAKVRNRKTLSLERAKVANEKISLRTSCYCYCNKSLFASDGKRARSRGEKSFAPMNQLI